MKRVSLDTTAFTEPCRAVDWSEVAVESGHGMLAAACWVRDG